jgi:tetratricopeptide (TPR) repeat protein
VVDPLQTDRTLEADSDSDRGPVVRLAPDPNASGDDPHGIQVQSGLDPIRRLPKTDPLDDDLVDRLPPVEPGILLPDDKLMRIESAAPDDADESSTSETSPMAAGDPSASSPLDDGSPPAFDVHRLPAPSTDETASDDSSMPVPDPLLRYLPPVPSEAERPTDLTLDIAASDAKNPLPLQGPLVITDEPAKPVVEAAPQGPWGVVIPPPLPDESSSTAVPPEPADPLVRLPEVEPAAPTDHVGLERGRGVRLAPPEDLDAAVGAPADAVRVSQQPIVSFDPSSWPAGTSVARGEVFTGAPQRLSIQDGPDDPPGYAPVPLPVRPLDGQPANVSRPLDASTLAVLDRNVTAITRRAEDLAARGAHFAARAEMIQALRAITQTLDANEGTREHSEALGRAMCAFQEAGDFAPRGSRLESDLDLAQVVSGHSTPVLKNENVNHLAPIAAQQWYLEYAQQQLAFAGGHLPSASQALYVLARIYTVLDKTQLETQMLCLPQAVALHQAALAVDPRNGRAANELGVLLVRFGQWEDARQVFLHSISVLPAPETWHNLSVVQARMGEVELARRAAEQSAAAVATQHRKQAPDVPVQSVHWVDPQTFSTVRSTPEP